MIKYPYLPKGRKFKYVGMDNKFMKMAFEVTLKYRGELKQPSGMVLVKDGTKVAEGSIGQNCHLEHGCERLKFKAEKIQTGTNYSMCPGCHSDNHSEANAIKDAKAKGNDTNGLDAYFWGHWWCCKDCWDKMIEAGIGDVYVLEGGEILFNKEHKDNIIGRQFKYFKNHDTRKTGNKKKNKGK